MIHSISKTCGRYQFWNDKPCELFNIVSCRLISCYSVKVKVLVTQLCPTLCDPMDCRPPGSSVHGILQARIVECLAHFLPQGIFPNQGQNMAVLHFRQTLYSLSHQGSPCYAEGSFLFKKKKKKGRNRRISFLQSPESETNLTKLDL